MAQPEEEQQEVVEITFSESELTTGMFAAVKLGKWAMVQQLIDMGVPSTLVDAKGWSLLLHASYFGYSRVVDVLLKNGAAAEYVQQLQTQSEQPAPRQRIVNSPLHWAILRGHVRVAWQLIQAGYSVLDVDQCGNNSLHLAAACTVPYEPVQLELLRTVLCAGADPDARNWQGQRAIDMLPRITQQHDSSNVAVAGRKAAAGGSDAQKLLAAAAAQTKCHATGTPFGADQLRFLCASSGKFFCEEASIAQNVAAFAPALPGITVPAADDEDAEAAVGRTFGLRLGNSHLPIATSEHDLTVTKPVRFGSDVSYKVGDAESALEAALNPVAHPSADGAAASSSSSTHEGSAGEEALQIELYFSDAHRSALEACITHVREVNGDVQLLARGLAALFRLDAAGRLKAAVAALNKARPLVTTAPTVPVVAAAAAARAAGVGSVMLSHATLAVAAAVAEVELSNAKAVAGAIPVGSHKYDANIARLADAVKRTIKENRAVARGVALDTELYWDTLEEERLAEEAAAAAEAARKAAEEAAIEAELARAAAEAAAAEGGAEAGAADAAAPAEAAAEEKKEAEEAGAGEGAATAGGEGEAHADGAAASTEGTQPVPVPERKPPHYSGPAPLPSNLVPLVPIAGGMLEEAQALLQRLTLEVSVSDAVDAARAKVSAAGIVATEHKEEDPTALPVPEVPADVAAARAAAAAAPPPAPSRPASGKGGKGAAAPAEPEAPPPPPPVDVGFPCDTAGVPLPDTPQLVALKDVRSACEALQDIIASSRSAGADAACITAAESALASVRAELQEALQAERTRVEYYRAEKAKADKKKGKKGGKK